MKKLIKLAFVAAFAAITGYGVYANQKTETMSDLMIANVEALAKGEYPASPNPDSKCKGGDLICAIWGKEMCLVKIKQSLIGHGSGLS